MKFRSDRTRIAIVGAAYRMPGVGSNGLWEALIGGRNLVSSVDPGRWEQDPYFHPRKGQPGTSYTFAAGSLGDVSGFDAGFFGISPREAEQMDPQQRLLLEMTWEAFESASIPPSSFRGEQCGVYIGLSSVDYAYRRADDLASLDATTMTGNTGSIAANRISYVFDLKGPSMVVDTACSSSLVALHQACQSIRHGESDAALVGGVSLHLHPYAFVGFSKASMLSPEGRCRVFDAAGDGYVRSEGGAIVLLKPLAQAIADGDPVLGVILETGVNNDGRKGGLTVPSYAAQAELLREVYARAAVDPTEIDYLEAHGTGTAVGDPIEARAIGEAIAQRRPRQQPLPIGSVKSHLGHLEAASGMAGLMKALGVLRHRQVPANLHLTSPSKHIDFEDWNLAPVTRPLALAADRRLIVGVSAFGFGGTNAHAVLSSFETQPVREPPVARPAAQPTAVPLILSARSSAALRASAKRMAALLRERPELSDYDIAYSAACTRDLHAYRLSATGSDRDSIAVALDRFAENGSAPQIVTCKVHQDASAPAFVFSGNGSQWAGMGVELIEREAVFRDTVAEVDSLLAAHSGRSVMADLCSAHDAGGLERTEVAQPALFALQVGLVRLLASYGIRPAAVCGHSVGEVAAAWACGALSLDAAVRVIHERSAHQAQTRGSGRMAAVALGEAEMAALLDNLGLAGRVVVAAFNAPGNITVAGDEDAIVHLGRVLAGRRIACRTLALDYAFHSRAMDAIHEQLLVGLEDLECGTETIPFYSAVSGGSLDGKELNATYWWHNIREPVRFESVIRAMTGAGFNTLVEIGPRPVLLSYIEETARCAGGSVLTVPTLSPKCPGSDRIRTVAQQLQLCAPCQDVRRQFPVEGRKVELPYYPWQRERFWHPSTAESLGLLSRRRVHPLLGHSLPGALHWENALDADSQPRLHDHRVAGAVVFPAAGFVEMALAAAAARRPGMLLAIEDLEILAPLVLDADHSKLVRLRVEQEDGRFAITSRDRLSDGEWRTHAVGRLVEDALTAPADLLHLPSRPPDVSAKAHYALATSMGLDYGPAFQSVTAVWREEPQPCCALALPECVADEADAYLLHPACLDGAFQLLMDVVARQQLPGEPVPTFLPVRIDRLELLQPHRSVAGARVSVRLSRHETRRSVRADFALHDAAGEQVAVARGVRFRAAMLQRSASRSASWLTARALAVPRRMTALALPSPAELARCCEQRLHEPSRAASRARFASEVEPLLDALCSAFAERLLRGLAGDAPVDPAQWQGSGLIAADGMPLARALLQMLVEDGVMRADGGHWQWAAADSTQMHFPEPRDIWASLIGDYPDYAPVIVRTGTAGARLLERLRGATPSELRERVARERSFCWADSCTQDEAVAVFGAIEDALVAAAAEQPVQARLRVLQIVGALPPDEFGDAVLPRLDPGRCKLELAAPSHEALEQWQARHARAAALDGEVFDPDDTGPAEERPSQDRFDIVVLSDGLSGSADPMRRLERLKGFLHPGGLLIVLEQHPSRAEDLRFASGQSMRRTPASWASLLTHAGFKDVETALDTPGNSVGPYLLLARVPEKSAENLAQSAIPPSRVWMLVHDTHGYSAELAASLAAEFERAGQAVIHITSGAQFSCDIPQMLTLDVTSMEHWERAITELERTGSSPDGWIHLAGLDLSTRMACTGTRIAAQESRAAVLLAWLQAVSRRSLQAQSWVVAAQSGLDLLPERARANVMQDDAPAPDRIRGASLAGLTRVAMQELPDQRIHWVDLADPLPAAANAGKLVQEILEPDGEDEIVLTAEGRFALRVQPLPELPVPAVEEPAAPAPVRLDFSVPGSFHHLEWREVAESAGAQPLLAEGEVEIDVRAAGLNFRDVMYAMGLLPDEAIEDGFCGPALGMEVSGIVRRVGPGVDFAAGDEVIGVAPAALAQRVRTRAFALARKPADWSFAAAATVPTAFFTAWYALAELARLQPGERVLIHGAAGGVGIAAIQVARHLGAEVFATAGTVDKRELVRLLGAERVFDSRSLKFADELLQSCDGVDVVLNSLAGEAMRRNLRLLRPFGRMVELGKRDFYENTRLGLRPLRNNITYFAFDADQLMARRPEVARRVFAELMARFASGALHPLPYRGFCASNVEAAFRQMQASHHIGKLVITFPDGFRPVVRRPARSPVQLKADAAYLVTGGLSGFGLRTAQWLASRGARHLVLMSRTGAPAPDSHAGLAELSRSGISVRCMACDVTDPNALRIALGHLRESGPPLRGVVHAAAVIEDALIRDLSREQLHRVLAPKIAGALHLHESTLGCELDFFLLYSSATTLFGNPGQGAYVAANMALEALAAERRASGLPATCVAWGPIADAGYLARHERVRDALVGRIGGRALEADEALRALDVVLAAETSHVGYLDLDWSVLGRFLPGARAPKFSELARLASRDPAAGDSAPDLRRWLRGLPEGEVLSALTEHLRRQVAQVLRIAPERIEPGVSLIELGMDSLMAVELAASIEDRLGLHLSALSLNDSPTVERIAARLVQQLHPVGETDETHAAPDELAEHVRAIAAQHASEISEAEAAIVSAVLKQTTAAPLSAGQTS
jgi:acyl transferase domain-containing protein/NADPH:quinone reductase-like Zn-dependent oxidoreductase/acyl carrier protein